MKQFNLYSHPVLGVQAVKLGFSWPAFFFTWIWAFVCKLWLRGAIMLVVLSLSSCFSMGTTTGLGMMMDPEMMDPDSPEDTEALGWMVLIAWLTAWMVWLVVSVVAGVRGNHWRDRQVREQGFGYLKTVPAQTPEAAILSAQGAEVAKE